MPDGYVILERPLPFFVNLDNGPSGEVSVQRGMKAGVLAVVAAPRIKKYGEGRVYILATVKERDVQVALTRGIHVGTGTAERGLVSAMRRAGVATLVPERLHTLAY